jgi:hypothetical protein
MAFSFDDSVGITFDDELTRFDDGETRWFPGSGTVSSWGTEATTNNPWTTENPLISDWT